MKIRALLSFPYGYKVHVKVLPASKYSEIHGADGLACWITTHQTIYLRDDRISAELWQDFIHELDHAWVDYREWLRNKVHE